ncbi:hypothetical protein T459_28144 [Capsicum annuum]|uniref:Uncharacterized protein n=1 Tax=Capsicum annuum TaxID=4072 RepID=A0A2G2YFZ9_CAPAN|nr:hypothetical protein T459_28144 [Capsicum annuum]
MQIDLSPISLRALTACRTTVGLCQLSTRYSISISMLQRLGGAGFRVRSRLHSTQSKRWERLKAAAQKPHRSHLLSLEYWIGRKGFAFRSLFEAGLDERGQVRDSLSLSAWSGSPPCHLKGEVAEASRKAKESSLKATMHPYSY